MQKAIEQEPVEEQKPTREEMIGYIRRSDILRKGDEQSLDEFDDRLINLLYRGAKVIEALARKRQGDSF